MPLDPEAQRVVDAMAALNLKPIESSTPDEARESLRTRTAALGPFEEVAAVADHRVPVAGDEITVRAYSPGGPGPHPVLVYYHGGGWVAGDLYTHDGLCRSIANAARCAVVSVDYRRAPEFKYPVAAEDSYAALLWIVAHAARLGVDPRRVAVGGDSAGGNLATVVALMARERRGPGLLHQVLIYPVTDHDLNTPSYLENATGYVLTREGMRWFWNHYLARDRPGRGAARLAAAGAEPGRAPARPGHDRRVRSAPRRGRGLRRAPPRRRRPGHGHALWRDVPRVRPDDAHPRQGADRAGRDRGLAAEGLRRRPVSIARDRRSGHRPMAPPPVAP